MVSKKNKPHSKHSYPSKSLGKVETTLSLDPLCSYESVAASALLSNCREKVGVVYNYELFKSARVSGGFKLFIEKVNDEIFDIIVEDVLRKKKNYGGPSSIERVAKSLRYAWKQMSLSTRSQWEMEARIRIKEAIKRTPNNGEGRNTHSSTEIEIREIEASNSEPCTSDASQFLPCTSNSCKDEPESSYVNGSLDVPSMPLCEISFRSEATLGRESRRLRMFFGIMPCPFCVSLGFDHEFKDVRRLMMHFMRDHFKVVLFACQFCRLAFVSREVMKRHPCSQFQSYIRKKTDGSFSACLLSLVCAECNLQLPLSFLDSREITEMLLMNLLELHSYDKLCPVVVYFMEKPPEDIRYVTLRANEQKISFRLSCPYCGQKNLFALDLEKHILSEHRDIAIQRKCAHCPRVSATSSYFGEHLLIHLGEQKSLVPLMDSLMFTAPEYATEESRGLSPNLAKVTNPRSGWDSFILEQGTCFDNYGATRSKRLKRGGGPPKQQQMEQLDDGKKLRKLEHDGVCESCYSAANVGPRNKNFYLKTDSCQCEKKQDDNRFCLPVHTGFVTDDNFLRSIEEKLVREAYVYVGRSDSLHDTSRGALLLSQVYICQTCNFLGIGDNHMKAHLRICCQRDVKAPDPEKEFDLKDATVVSRLHVIHPAPDLNPRIICPHCPTTCCSIASLRYHLALQHCILAPFNPIDNVGVFEWRECKRQFGDLHEQINILCDLEGRGREELNSVNDSNDKLGSSSAVSPVIVPIEKEMAVMGNNISASKSRREQGWKCALCMVHLQSVENLTCHFISCHVYLCGMCGAAFTESNYLKEHHRTCQRWPRKVNDGEFFPECRLCTLILSSPVLYYSHIHMFHREKLLVEASTEQIVPALTWKKITPADAEKLRQQNETSWEYQNMLPAAWLDADYENTDLLKGNEKELGIPEAAISEQRHSEEHCFLCEKIFDSASEVKRHMDEHTEKWLSCPACNVNNREFPVASYQDLLDHLVRNHIDRSDADQGKKLICSFCCICYRCEGRDAASVRSTEEEMARHILYTCNGGRTCLICNNGKVVTVDALKKHRLEKHRVIYERFGCSECPKKFVLRSDFCKHLCNIRYKCSCANPKLFTEREFEEHFATHLNDANDFCNLCIRFLATKQNRLSHMNVHRIMTQGDRHITDIEGNVDTSKKEKEEVLPNAAVCHDSVEISGIGEPVGCNSRLNVENDLDRVSPSPSSSVPSVESSMPNLNGMPMPNNFLARVRQEKDVSPLLQLLTSTPDAAADFSNEALLADTDDEVLIIDAKGEADRTTSSDVTSFAWPVQNEESACLPTGFRSDGTNSEQELEAKKHDRSIQHELVTQNHDISIRSTTLVDDEIQILSEVEEHSSGSVKKREPQVPCSYCSAKFLTRASLRAHIDSHRYDAGNTLVEVYGVPLNVDVYLCRLCCLAYESREIYLKHMKTHGPLLNCEMCCVVTFNDEQVMQHKQQHVGCDKIRPNIYVCFYCAVTYLTEMRIYHHLLNVHGCCLVYFCKSCGFANTYGRTVLHHVKHSLCASSTGRPVHSKDFSVTLSSNFHYQPVDPKAYEVSVHQKSLSVVVPSECIHRTYLMQTGDNVFISCPMCSCLVGFTRLSNEMPARIKTLSRFLKSAKDDNDDILRGLITQWESELVIEAVASRPPIVQTVASLFTESGLRSVPVNPTNALLGCNGTAFDPTSVGMRLNGAVPPEVPPVRRSSNSKIRVNMQPQCQPQNELQSTLGMLHINQSSLAAAAFSSSSPTPLIMNQDAPCSNTSVLSVNSTAGRTALSSVKSGLDSVPKRLFSTSLTPPTQHSQARRNPCKFTKDYTIRLQDGFLHCIDPKCKEIRMDKESSGHVHNLKHNPMNIFFCFDCGDAFPAERYAVIHQFEMHRKNELPEIRLKCPLCPFDDPFTNLKDFKCHLRDVSHNLFEHAILRYPMREDICDLKFGTDFARTVHQIAHAEANIASRECCSLCGSCNFWKQDATGRTPTIEHTYLHAFKLWAMCRECGLCFPHEAPFDQFMRHYMAAHLTGMNCNICNRILQKSKIDDHARAAHFVTGLKSDRTRPFRLETNMTVMYKLLGLKETM